MSALGSGTLAKLGPRRSRRIPFASSTSRISPARRPVCGSCAPPGPSLCSCGGNLSVCTRDLFKGTGWIRGSAQGLGILDKPLDRLSHPHVIPAPCGTGLEAVLLQQLACEPAWRSRRRGLHELFTQAMARVDGVGGLLRALWSPRRLRPPEI